MELIISGRDGWEGYVHIKNKPVDKLKLGAHTCERYKQCSLNFTKIRTTRLYGFLYSLRCKDDCYQFGRGVGKQLRPDTDVTHTSPVDTDYRKDQSYTVSINTKILMISMEDFCLAKCSKTVCFVFRLHLSKSYPGQPVKLLGLSRTND